MGGDFFWRPGQDNLYVTGENYFEINGGYVAINANGDGIDINGTITMSGGTLIIHGPTSNMNGAIDYLGSFKISGGTLIATGSSGMAMAPSNNSEQCCVSIIFQTVQQPGTLVHIRNENGEEMLTFSPDKSYQSLVFSSPEIKRGMSLIIFTGGSSSGTSTDGLYIDGTYTAGTQQYTVLVSDIINYAGTAPVGFPGNMMPGGNMFPPGGRKR